MIRFALAVAAISLLGACSYKETTTVEARPAQPATVAAPPGSTVITNTPTSTTYTTGGSSTTVLK